MTSGVRLIGLAGAVAAMAGLTTLPTRISAKADTDPDSSYAFTLNGSDSALTLTFDSVDTTQLAELEADLPDYSVELADEDSGSGEAQHNFAHSALSRSLSDPTTELAPHEFPGGGGGTTDYISCAHGTYSYKSPDGTHTLRNNCSYKNVNWGWQFSAQLQSEITGYVYEDGMLWSVNGGSPKKGARHTEPADYQFHGTMSPCATNDYMEYVDDLYFNAVVGGETASGQEEVYGSIICVA